VDVDFWLHVRIGDELRKGVAFGALPDPLVALADRPYVPTQWLAEVVQSVIYQRFGLEGVQAFRILGIILLILFVYLAARCFASPFPAALTTLIAVLATSGAWGERPQLAGLVLGSLFLLIWARAWTRGTVPWLVLPLLWLWACLHGSWILGIATGLLFSLGMIAGSRLSKGRPWQLLALHGLSVLAVASTPLGPGLLLSPFHVGAAAREAVAEWQRPSWGNPLLVLVLIMVAAGVAHLVRRRAPLIMVLLPVAAAAMALSAVRTIAFGALLAAPAFAAALSGRDVADRGRVALRAGSPMPWMAVSVLLILALPGMANLPESDPLRGRIATSLAQLPHASHVAVDKRLSGWVLHEYPKLVPLRDLRAEVYSAQVANEYDSFMGAEEGWQSYADAHEVRAIVVQTGSELDTALSGARDWERVASEEEYQMWTPIPPNAQGQQARPPGARAR
jgi:hypothetical protein